MSQNLGFRFFIIALVVGFLGFQAYQGAYSEPGLELGIDLQGGSEIEGKFDFSQVEEKLRADLLNEAIGIIQQRIDAYGLKDIAIQPVGSDRFTVQIAATEKENVDSIKDLITVLGKLEFRITVEPDAPNYDTYWKRFEESLKNNVPLETARVVKAEDRAQDDIDNNRYPLGLRWYPLSDKGREQYGLNRRPPNGEPWVLCEVDDYNVTGESLQNATYRLNTEGFGGDYNVVFDIKKLHHKNMSALTSRVGTFMAIALNNEVDSAPELQSVLTDSGRITGSFAEEEARGLAAVLKAGALQQKPDIIAERTVASDLAGSARNRGVYSIAIGFIAVLVLMIWLYVWSGFLANIALMLNMVLVVGVLYWFGAVLTLPGLAGLVLTVGMAVDANILIFERIKEEKSKGRTLAQAIATGYDRATVTIIDANLTTLITAYMLFQIGSGPVRGFGITLAIGIIASMFTAIYVTRSIFALLMKRGAITEARMRGTFSPPTIPWMSKMRPAVTASAIAIIAGFVIFDVVPDKSKYDLDFTQGAKLIMSFNKTVQLDDVRDKLDGLGKSNPKFRNINARVSTGGIGAQVVATEGQGFELRTQEIGHKEDVEALVAALRESFKDSLVPGPFESTLATAGSNKSTGTIYFLKKIEKAWVEQALEASGRFPGATVAVAKAVPGVESAFLVSLNEPAEGERKSAIALNLRHALRRFDAVDRRNQLLADSTDDTVAAADKEKAAAAAAALESFPDPLPPGFFDEADPFPLADRIDPSTAREHRDAAIQAIALSILGIIAYVAFRFRSWAFGFAAVVALIHDVLVVLGIVTLCNWLGLVDARLNLVTVAAYLTLIGYSINDSIVVFDRIRENRGSSRARMHENIDRSLNQTLSRTLRTTGTTWVVVAILFAMNYNAGSTLEGFAFILVLGVLVGTYSSIFVASPTLLYLPWLWDKCGQSAKTLALKVLPWSVGAAVVLLGVDAASGRFGVDDPSRLIFNDVMLGIPLGLLAMFLLNFVRFARQEKAAEAARVQTA
ncbi:MAG: protein translocase subunit SecD [Planctomycetota bacterium]|jgi:SecD/SecF fusion protein